MSDKVVFQVLRWAYCPITDMPVGDLIHLEQLILPSFTKSQCILAMSRYLGETVSYNTNYTQAGDNMVFLRDGRQYIFRYFEEIPDE